MTKNNKKQLEFLFSIGLITLLVGGLTGIYGAKIGALIMPNI